MGRVIVQIDPSLLQGFITEGNVFGENNIVRITSGLPDTAKFLRCWVDQTKPPDGVIVLLFEDESFPTVDEGDEYPSLRVEVVTEIKRV